MSKKRDYEEALASYREILAKDPPEDRTAEEIELMCKVLAEHDGVLARLAAHDRGETIEDLKSKKGDKNETS